MKTLFRTSLLLTLILLTSVFGAFAQTAPSINDLAPVVQTNDLPKTIIVAGTGVRGGNLTGFTNILQHLTGPVYGAFAEDVSQGTTKTRVGLETVVYRHGDLFVTGKGNVGVATGGGATGGAYGAGGSLNYRLSRFGAKNWLLGASATYDYSNIADFGRAITTAGGRQQVERLFGAGTYRFYAGRTFPNP
jgi:hypothetical protein